MGTKEEGCFYLGKRKGNLRDSPQCFSVCPHPHLQPLNWQEVSHFTPFLSFSQMHFPVSLHSGEHFLLTNSDMYFMVSAPKFKYLPAQHILCYDIECMTYKKKQGI